MRVIPLLCLLGLLALPALAQQKLLPSQIKPDARMVNTAGTEIYLLRARPARLFNFLGQPVTGAVEVLNNTNAAKTLTVRAFDRAGNLAMAELAVTVTRAAAEPEPSPSAPAQVAAGRRYIGCTTTGTADGGWLLVGLVLAARHLSRRRR